MASRTREKLIEVAKQLFIRKGVENTTISDIANASDKGRRTIYTYFKNKKEIYKAVIERESDKMVGQLKDIVFSNCSPADKLSRFIGLRIPQSRTSGSPYSAMRFLSSIDFGRNEKVRKMALEKEETLLNSIIDEGIEKGDFDPQRAEMLRLWLFPVVRSIDNLNTDEDGSVADFNFLEALSKYIGATIKTK